MRAVKAGWLKVTAMTVAAAFLVAGCGNDDNDGGESRAANAGEWKTWVLKSGGEGVPPPPKAGSAARSGLERRVMRGEAAPADKASPRVLPRAGGGAVA